MSARAWKEMQKKAPKTDPNLHPFNIQRNEAGQIIEMGKEEPIQYCLKNKSPEEIVDIFYEIRSRWGNKAHPLHKAKYTYNPSIQGIWNPWRIIY